MWHLEWMGLLLGLALPADLVCTKYRDWHMRQLAIKRGRTLTRKFALPPHRSRGMS
jgi:hypothetical protein